MKQIILAAMIMMAVTSCGNNSNKDNSDTGDTTKVTTLLPATDTIANPDTSTRQNRMTDTMQNRSSKDSMMKKKDSANKKAKK